MRLPRAPRPLLLALHLVVVLLSSAVVDGGPDRDARAAMIVSSCPSERPAPGGSWCPRYLETFATPTPEGSFVHRSDDDWYLHRSNPYADSLRSYPDGWGTTGDHSLNYASRTASVVPRAYGVDGVFVLRARSEVVDHRTRALAGSFFPVLDPDASATAQTAQTYGRYTVRFRTRGGFATGTDPDRQHGYGTAFLLWPANDHWPDGEIDFPEMAWGSKISGYVHTIGQPQVNHLAVTTGTRTDSDWVTATIEWSPGLIRFLLDGAEVGRTTRSVPTVPLRWGFQSGGASRAPAADVSGELYVDRIEIESYQSGSRFAGARRSRPGLDPSGPVPPPRGFR